MKPLLHEISQRPALVHPTLTTSVLGARCRFLLALARKRLEQLSFSCEKGRVLAVKSNSTACGRQNPENLPLMSYVKSQSRPVDLR